METIQIGNKIVPVSGYDANGKPIIKATSEEIHHPDGRIDVIVKVPCLSIQAKQENLEGKNG